MITTRLPRELNGHVYLSTQLWRTERSMPYDIDASSAARKLLAEIPLPELHFLIRHDGKPRFAYGLNQQAYAVLSRMVGDDKAELARFSPAKLAERITIPVLLIHGGKDGRAPKEHAEDMRAALVKVGRPPEGMFVDYEGHGFYDTKNVTAMYEKLEAFLAKHIGK